MRRFEVRAVVFDMDGVLVDTEAINVSAAFEAFSKFGHVLGGEARTSIVGRHPADYVPAIASRFGVPEDVQRQIRELQGRIYVRLWGEKARLKDGVREILPWLRRRGYRLGIATSGGRKHVELCLGRFDLGGFFEVVLTKDDVERRKPDPEIYFACAERFGLAPSDMLVVEDSEHGVRAAVEAGARCVAVSTPETTADRIAGADATLAGVMQLRELLATG